MSLIKIKEKIKSNFHFKKFTNQQKQQPTNQSFEDLKFYLIKKKAAENTFLFVEILIPRTFLSVYCVVKRRVQTKNIDLSFLDLSQRFFLHIFVYNLYIQPKRRTILSSLSVLFLDYFLFFILNIVS